MNHVNGFDTTGADLKLVELFAARQLCSSTQSQRRGGTKRRQSLSKTTTTTQSKRRPRARAHPFNSTGNALRSAAVLFQPLSVLSEPQWCCALVVKLSHHEPHNHRHYRRAATTSIHVLDGYSPPPPQKLFWEGD